MRPLRVDGALSRPQPPPPHLHGLGEVGRGRRVGAAHDHADAPDLGAGEGGGGAPPQRRNVPQVDRSAGRGSERVAGEEGGVAPGGSGDEDERVGRHAGAPTGLERRRRDPQVPARQPRHLPRQAPSQREPQEDGGRGRRHRSPRRAPPAAPAGRRRQQRPEPLRGARRQEAQGDEDGEGVAGAGVEDVVVAVRSVAGDERQPGEPEQRLAAPAARRQQQGEQDEEVGDGQAPRGARQLDEVPADPAPPAGGHRGGAGAGEEVVRVVAQAAAQGGGEEEAVVEQVGGHPGRDARRRPAQRHPPPGAQRGQRPEDPGGEEEDGAQGPDDQGEAAQGAGQRQVPRLGPLDRARQRPQRPGEGGELGGMGEVAPRHHQGEGRGRQQHGRHQSRRRAEEAVAGGGQPDHREAEQQRVHQPGGVRQDAERQQRRPAEGVVRVPAAGGHHHALVGEERRQRRRGRARLAGGEETRLEEIRGPVGDVGDAAEDGARDRRSGPCRRQRDEERCEPGGTPPEGAGGSGGRRRAAPGS